MQCVLGGPVAQIILAGSYFYYKPLYFKSQLPVVSLQGFPAIVTNSSAHALHTVWILLVWYCHCNFAFYVLQMSQLKCLVGERPFLCFCKLILIKYFGMSLSQGFDLCLWLSLLPPIEIPQHLDTASPRVFIFPVQCGIFQQCIQTCPEGSLWAYRDFHFIRNFLGFPFYSVCSRKAGFLCCYRTGPQRISSQKNRL